MRPGDGGMGLDETHEILPALCISSSGQPVREVEVVPADDALLDQTVAGFGNFLLLLFGLRELMGVADGHGAGEFVGQLHLVELLFDGLPEFEIVDVAQDEQRLDDLAEGLERLVRGPTTNGTIMESFP